MSEHRPVTLSIAKNEISRICQSPIVIVLAALMLGLAFTNAAGCSELLPRFTYMSHDEVFFYVGLGNFFWNVSMLFSFISICVAVVSFMDDRQGSMLVLLTKPVYRRDVMLGKFFGILSFLLLMIVLSVSLFVALIMITYGGPGSVVELFLRAGSFALLLFLSCALIVGIVIILSILFNKAEALMIALGFIALEYLSQMPWIPPWIGDIKIINPVNAYLSAFSVSAGNDLYTTSLTYFTWLNHAIPYIALMITEVVLMMLIGSFLFSRQEQ